MKEIEKKNNDSNSNAVAIEKYKQIDDKTKFVISGYLREIKNDNNNNNAMELTIMLYIIF